MCAGRIGMGNTGPAQCFNKKKSTIHSLQKSQAHPETPMTPISTMPELQNDSNI